MERGKETKRLKGLSNAEQKLNMPSADLKKTVGELVIWLSVQHQELSKTDGRYRYFTDNIYLLRRKNKSLKKQLSLYERIISKGF